jgi:hypothetical protein
MDRLESINLLLCSNSAFPMIENSDVQNNHKIFPVTNVGIKKMPILLNLSFSVNRDSRVA